MNGGGPEGYGPNLDALRLLLLGHLSLGCIIPVMRKPEPTETEIQKQIVQVLNLHPRVKCWRQNSGSMRGKYQVGLPGCGDITGVIAPWGTRLEIEVKRAKKKQSDDQATFQREVEHVGAVYFIAHSMEEATEKLRIAIEELRQKSSGAKSWGSWAP